MTNEMIQMYDNYIYYIISRYYSHYPSPEDLLQVGRIGLMIAYQNYDPSYQTKFTTYAFSAIKGEMSRWIRQDKGAKYSRNLTKLKLLIERETAILTQQLMRSPTTKELADYLGEPEENIIEAMQVIYQMKSLQEPITQEERELTIEDSIAGPQVDIDQMILLKDSIASLSSLDQELITRRYLYGETQSEIAEHMGMTQVQVSRKTKKLGNKIHQIAA